jgi:hypothetical protein
VLFSLQAQDAPAATAPAAAAAQVSFVGRVTAVRGLCRVREELVALVQISGRPGRPALVTTAQLRAAAPELYMDYLESRVVFEEAVSQTL